MNVLVRVGGFFVAIGAVSLLAAALGAAVGPLGTQTHGKRLHLIVVRRDLSSFQHVHPTIAADGVWAVGLDLSKPGPYRVFADFKPDGAKKGYTLGHDLTVPGDYEPRGSTAPSRTDSVDGYEVTLSGELSACSTSEVTLTVRRDGKPVVDLEPYLEARPLPALPRLPARRSCPDCRVHGSGREPHPLIPVIRQRHSPIERKEQWPATPSPWSA